MDKKGAVDEEELSLAIAAMSTDEKMEFWERIIDTNREVAEELFLYTLLRDAAAGYEPQPKEDHRKARFFEPPQPPPANEPGSPPLAALKSRTTVLPLGAPARRRPNNATPSTTAPRAAQGKKPRCTTIIGPRGAGKEVSEGHQQEERFFLQQRQPSTTKRDQAPENSFQAVTVLCAPPHLAREVKTSTECAPRAEKHRAV